ncbi:hypothetical protein PV04_08377 [Phialophora macrospora]|uniref:Major facilitator superfamily (MFS) profile domain-containing protein n=1 Tax=Phialophora macrospora TaxID=1851006 RepID=A0A0D2CLR2_9EURO|nr:hypothetical protein PV04_08377 [Phialophora macrospora]
MASSSFKKSDINPLEATVSLANGDLAEKRDADVATEFLASLDPAVTNGPITASEARKVLWKIDLIILPIIAGTVILSAVDKVIISNASILGMKQDTGLSGSQFSWVGSIFYFGFLFFEWSAAVLIQKLPVAKLLAGLVFSWAVLMCCTGATQNFAGLATVRFVMGCTEAGAFPIASILTVMWYTNAEQPIRVAFWYNQFSSIFSGLVSYGIGLTHTSLAQWRLLFIVLGCFSLLWSVVILIFLPDRPDKCWYLSERERYICVTRISGNNTGLEDKRLKWYQVRECLLDPKQWLLALFACAQNIPNGGLVTFSAIIVKGLGYDTLTTTLLGVPTGVIATLWQLILSVPCAKLKGKRCTVIAVANVVPLTCAVLMWKLPKDHKRSLLAAYYVFYTYWGPYVMSTSVPMANVSGHTKKVTVNAMYFLAYCAGNIIGPQVFRQNDAPDYSHGYIGLLACFVVASVAIASYGFLCYHENARRDRELNGPTTLVVGVEDSFSDRTDKEKVDFRYMY